MSQPQLSRALLQNLGMFRNLPDADLDSILQHARVCRLQEGDAAFLQGEDAAEFFVLLSGRLKVVQVTPEGEQIIVRHVNPGDIFGMAKAMSRRQYPASTVAVQESLALAWPAAAWDTLVSRSPQFAAGAIQTVGQRLQDAHSRIRELSTEEVEQRVARALLRLVESSSTQTLEGQEIDFPITRQEIAEMTGTTLHTVSRLLSAWKNDGIILSGRRRITVCSVDKLAQLARAEPPATPNAN
ncbi:MAG TPA: Crp/Fnr family transcriptional regulator [Burkholderiaceae bacterium]|nr:Crp/Fnr family transcriptional regulator [Burkholderiaceae bacterium]